MAHFKSFRPIEFRQVCAIARVVFLQSPQMTDAEWKGAIADTCVKQGWEPPDSELMARAMGAVERALQQTTGKKRVVAEPSTEPAVAKPERCWTAADLKLLADTVKRVMARSAGATPTNVRTIPQERWEISEPAALDEFYRQAEVDRMGALRRFAEIAIARPADWDFGAIRAAAEAKPGPLSNWQRECFACRRTSRQFVSHHIIQIQHGGSNYARNRVSICEDCHAKIHPWLPRRAAPEKSGWFRVGSLTPQALREVFERQRKDRVS